MSTEHGTLAAYKRGCRCDKCRQASRIHARQRRWAYNQGKPIPGHVEHGRHSTYINYMCRCDLCNAANVEAQRAYRAQRRAPR